MKEFINKIICGDCLDVLRKICDESIDLVVTSPPYITRRKEYNSVSEELYVDWFFEISQEIMRVLKHDGSFVLNIKEGTRKTGVKETYILEYVLRMAKAYRWNETFIWDKIQPMPTGIKNRLKDGWEYCFQFTKNKEYKFYVDQYVESNNDGLKRSINKNTILGGVKVKNDEFKRPSNVFSFHTSTISRKQVDHPAMYPLELPRIFINLMTKQGDTVLDPFSGSGSTALVAKTNARNFIGVDMSEKYCKMARKRINQVGNVSKIFNPKVKN